MTLSLVVIEAEGESSAISVTGGWREHLETFWKDGRRTSLSIAFRGADILSAPVFGQTEKSDRCFDYRTFSATEMVGLGGVIFSAVATRVGRQPETRAAPGILAATNRTVLAGAGSLVARLGLLSSNSSTAPRLASLGLVEGVLSESRVADFVFGNAGSGVGRKAVSVFAGASASVLPAGTRR